MKRAAAVLTIPLVLAASAAHAQAAKSAPIAVRGETVYTLAGPPL